MSGASSFVEPEPTDPRPVVGAFAWAILAPSGRCAVRVQPNGQRGAALFRSRSAAEKAAPAGFTVVEAAYVELGEM